MSYRIAGIDVHKKMLAVVVTDVEVEGEYEFERRQFGTTPDHLRLLNAKHHRQRRLLPHKHRQGINQSGKDQAHHDQHNLQRTLSTRSSSSLAVTDNMIARTAIAASRTRPWLASGWHVTAKAASDTAFTPSPQIICLDTSGFRRRVIPLSRTLPPLPSRVVRLNRPSCSRPHTEEAT
jgi:hypothetical protein